MEILILKQIKNDKVIYRPVFEKKKWFGLVTYYVSITQKDDDFLQENMTVALNIQSDIFDTWIDAYRHGEKYVNWIKENLATKMSTEIFKRFKL